MCQCVTADFFACPQCLFQAARPVRLACRLVSSQSHYRCTATYTPSYQIRRHSAQIHVSACLLTGLSLLSPRFGNESRSSLAEMRLSTEEQGPALLATAWEHAPDGSVSLTYSAIKAGMPCWTTNPAKPVLE